MMMMRNSAPVLLLAFMVLPCVGCATHFKLDSAPVETWPEHHQLDMPIRLVLTPEFVQYEYVHRLMGDRRHYAMGRALAANAEAMAHEAFRTVLVDRAAATSMSGSIPTLVPSVSDTQLVFGWNALEKVPMTIDVCWSLYDLQGNLVWMETVRGESLHHYGTGLTYRKEARKRVNMLMEDLFVKSLTALTNAPAVQAFAGEHP